MAIGHTVLTEIPALVAHAKVRRSRSHASSYWCSYCSVPVHLPPESSFFSPPILKHLRPPAKFIQPLHFLNLPFSHLSEPPVSIRPLKLLHPIPLPKLAVYNMQVDRRPPATPSASFRSAIFFVPSCFLLARLIAIRSLVRSSISVIFRYSAFIVPLFVRSPCHPIIRSCTWNPLLK